MSVLGMPASTQRQQRLDEPVSRSRFALCVRHRFPWCSQYNHPMQRAQTGITGFTLKLAAIIGMTANHVAHVFLGQLPVFVAEALYWLGGITFPVMAFLIVEGYQHTSSVSHYLRRLALFAVVSQVPYTLLFGWTGNIFFTLAIGLALVWFFDTHDVVWMRAGVLLLGLAVSYFCDWAVLGPLMILLFLLLRTHPQGVLITMALPFASTVIPACGELMAAVGGVGSVMPESAVGLLVSFQSFADATRMMGLPLSFANTLMTQVCQLGYALIGFTLAAILLLSYNGQRGLPLKWAFYAYYPAHLAVIWVIRQALS